MTPTLTEIRDAIRDGRLTQADVLRALKRADPNFDAKWGEYIKKARAVYANPSDSDIEIDDQPLISDTDDGVWVSAWVWVPKPLEDE